MLKIGYLIPEFPGQTHGFFWREREALRRLGIDPDLVSTRRPAAALVSHTWSAQAMAETDYLFPLRLRHVPDAIRGLTAGGPRGLARLAWSLRRAEGFGVVGRARLAALAILGGRLAHIAKRRGWRHVHVHSCADAAHVALFAHLLSGVGYSLTLHSPLGYFGPNQREKWRHAAFAIVITDRLLAEVRALLPGSLPKFVDVVPMGVDVDRFRPSGRRDGGGSRAGLRVFSCGRLTRSKGFEFLIEGIARLRERGLDATLVVAGEDDADGAAHRKLIEMHIAKFGLEQHVRLLGAVSEDRILRELGEADVFSLASLDEALGVSIMEAMAMELPVVATRVGGVPELVEDGVDGLLVPAWDAASLAQGIERVAQNPDLAATLGRAARLKIVARFHSSRSAEQLARRIREVAPDGPAA